MHSIPEAFFKELNKDNSVLRIHTNVKGKHKKKAPTGIYDINLLCYECEQKFQKMDNYAIKTLIHDGPKEEIYQHSKIGYIFRNIDNSQLKLFFMAVLWRASISKQEFYAKVNLGKKLETKLKNLIWNESCGEKNEFSFFLAKFEKESATTIFDPHPERWDNVKYYRFYLGEYIVHIKADSQKTPAKWEKFIPSDDVLYIVSRGDLETSKEFDIIKIL